MRLWLARHAAVPGADGICYGASDLAPDERATVAAARGLAGALPSGLRVRSSPLQRCARLAEALHALRPDLAPQPDARLAEMDFGDWEGRAWHALGRAALDAWTADFAHHRCGGGESVASFMARVREAFEEARADGEVLWITHAGVVRAVRLLARGVTMVHDAREWPVEGLAPAAWECIALPGESLS